MNIKLLEDKSIIDELELLRSQAFGFDTVASTYYSELLFNDKMTVILAYINDELAGAAYVTRFNHSTCIVDQLFVKPKYQFTDYHVGTELLKYIERNINSIKDDYEDHVNRLLISPGSEESEKIYRDQGYQDTRLDGTLYKRVR